MDIILAVRRPEGHQPSNRRVIESLSRYRETPEKIVVELTPEGYHYLGSEEAVAATEAAVFVSFAIGSGFRTKGIGPDLAELVQMGAEHDPPVRRTNLTTALLALYAKGDIQRSGEGKRGDPYRYRPRDADSFVTQTVEKENANETGVDLRTEALRIFGDEL